MNYNGDVNSISDAHRAALEAAIEKLPSVDDETWTVPEGTLKAAGLVDDLASARKFVLQFALWARTAINRLPRAPCSDMEATDFNDYYKIVMSRVQFLYSQASSGAAAAATPEFPVCCFQTQLRRRPTFRKQGVDSCSGVFDLKGAHQPAKAEIRVEGSLEGSMDAFRAALADVGARKFSAATLRALVADRAPKAAGIESNLAPINDAWMAALDGQCLFTLLPDGAAFSGAPSAVECRIDIEDGHAVLLAQGPWFRVTFCETPLLQCMSQFFTDSICALGDHDGESWCREACMNFATTVHNVSRTCPPGAFSLFSGRRTPHPPFHLLQHMYICEQLGGMPTSSLFAGRCLGAVGMPQQLIGTLAHEGPMGFMCLHPEMDTNLPMSALLWHLLFWGMTGNRTILPDGHGSATFKAMLQDLGLLADVTIARQDSGHLSRFAAIYSGTAKMASEIETFKDITTALSLGYVAFGAGGFFGEKRRVVTPEFSLAAKLVKAHYKDASGADCVGYSAKLGDCSDTPSGSWADYVEGSKLPTKFIVSPDADRKAMWERMLAYGRKGDVWFDQGANGGAPPPLVRKSDAAALVTAMRALCASPAMSAAQYSEMVARIEGFAKQIEGAAAALPL